MREGGRGSRERGVGVNREPELATFFKVLFDAGDSARSVTTASRAGHGNDADAKPWQGYSSGEQGASKGVDSVIEVHGILQAQRVRRGSPPDTDKGAGDRNRIVFKIGRGLTGRTQG